VATAWFVFNNPQLLEGAKTKNHGELITPAIPYTFDQLISADGDSRLDDFTGRWVLVHLDVDGVCSKSCEKSVDLVHQLNILLNKDSRRLRRMYLHMSANANVTQFAGDPKLKVFVWGEEQLKELNQHVKNLQDGDMLLIDPLGNIMMKYKEDADPYGIQKDLKLLFKTSQIG
jgi:hypothetical protein